MRADHLWQCLWDDWKTEAAIAVEATIMAEVGTEDTGTVMVMGMEA